MAILGSSVSWGVTFYLIYSGWICDGPLYSNGQYKSCATDGGGADGHREIIMTTGKEVGCGNVFSSIILTINI